MRTVMALVKEGRIEMMDLEAFDRALGDYVVSFMLPFYMDGYGDVTAVAFQGRERAVIPKSYRDVVLRAYLAHFCMTLKLVRKKTNQLLAFFKIGHVPFYNLATQDVMVETKCRSDNLGRDTAYGCYNATLYQKCGGVQSDEGLEYCDFFFPKKPGSHPERFKKLMRFSIRLLEIAKEHFQYKKD